ncbi:hypothetical protein H4R24_001283 [Coemansia sp. RSA 988]|nr:hypothetical protein H4R24_001283 [Coemansia sp. RSA 988]
MACDLSDPKIAEVYHHILSNDDIDWMIIGYGSTRDCLSLYASGSGGVGEMALKVPNEIVFCFVAFEGSRVLITHVSEKISNMYYSEKCEQFAYDWIVQYGISADSTSGTLTSVARGLAHQNEIAEFFSHHDVTVNTTKPSELTSTMLRDKTRHLAIKSVPLRAGSLRRSDTAQPSKLKHSVWHQRSQGSSRASSPSATSFSGDTAGLMDLKGVPEVSTWVEVEAETASEAQTETTQSVPVDATAPALGEDKGTRVGDIPTVALQNLDLAAPNNAVEECGATRFKGNSTQNMEAQGTSQQDAPLQAPPTPKSFTDMPVSAPAVASRVARSPTTAREFEQTDSPIFSHFDYDVQRAEISPAVAENYVQMDSPTAPISDNRHTSILSSPGAGGSPSPTIVQNNTAQRHESVRLRQKSMNRRRRTSILSATLSPSQPEVAMMLEQVNEHRKDVAELAMNTGILGDKFFKCLRGYTNIQEPEKAFWKRRYFAIADNTLFMYTNECSRTPSDCLPIDTVVSTPRDAEDEVLMPNSIAIDFGDGEYYMYFDTLTMRQAFESEVQKAISAA